MANHALQLLVALCSIAGIAAFLWSIYAKIKEQERARDAERNYWRRLYEQGKEASR